MIGPTCSCFTYKRNHPHLPSPAWVVCILGTYIHFVSQEICPSGFVGSVPDFLGLNASGLEVSFEMAVFLTSGARGGFGIVE